MRKLIIGLIVLSGAWFVWATDWTEHASTYTPPIVEQVPIEMGGLLELSNKERTQRGLGALALSEALNQSAADKCTHMQQHDYWAHTAPDGTEPWYFIKKYTNYTWAGENLAYGQQTAQETTEDWMNSETHKRNILDSHYTQVGFAVCDFRNTNLIVQHLKG